MLYPVKILLAYQVDAGETKLFELEEQVLTTAKTIFNPVLYLINRSTGLAHFKVEWVLDAGQGNDPLYSGTFTYVGVDEDVNAGNLLAYAFLGDNLDSDDDLASRHSVSLENKSATTQIYWVLLVGRAELQTQLAANQEIIKE
jgi:hypothetical protein